MKEHGILFMPAMVRAYLAGQKSQTRRLLYSLGKARKNDRLHNSYAPPRVRLIDGFPNIPVGHQWRLSHWIDAMVGDRLWGRETYARAGCRGNCGHLGCHTIYRADEAKAIGAYGAVKWTPSIHMPRWASRITPLITGHRVERLQNISESDAIAEGVVKVGSRWEVPGIVATPVSAADAYRALWCFINGKESWAENPWVVVISFERFGT